MPNSTNALSPPPITASQTASKNKALNFSDFLC
jgi:hypothetical protein